MPLREDIEEIRLVDGDERYNRKKADICLFRLHDGQDRTDDDHQRLRHGIMFMGTRIMCQKNFMALQALQLAWGAPSGQRHADKI